MEENDRSNLPYPCGIKKKKRKKKKKNIIVVSDYL